MVMGHDTPHVQLGSILCLNVSVIILFVIYKPFVDKLPNAVEITNYALFSFVTALFFIQTFESLELTQDFKYNRLGWIIMLLLVILVFVNFAVVIYEMSIEVVAFLKKFKKWWGERK